MNNLETNIKPPSDCIADDESTDEVINHNGNGHRTVRSGFQEKLGPCEESEF